jgi:hypothetical protein
MRTALEEMERGRITLLNALKAIAERSTSHEDAVQLARKHLRDAGCWVEDHPLFPRHPDERASPRELAVKGTLPSRS